MCFLPTNFELCRSTLSLFFQLNKRKEYIRCLYLAAPDSAFEGPLKIAGAGAELMESLAHHSERGDE